MTRRYLMLATGLLLAGLALVGLGRMHRASPVRAAEVMAPTRVTLEVAIDESGVVPSPVVVPVNARARLHVVNRGTRAIRLTLAGYQDRLGDLSLRPGEAVDREFLADRPGQDFAWLVDGHPLGRFVVSGSHLVEGHR
jgi:hypothetical protein